MSLIKFWIYHDDFGLSDTFWFIIIMKKKSATGLIIKLFWSKDACTKEPSFPFALEYHIEIIQGVTKLKIYIRVITRG